MICCECLYYDKSKVCEFALDCTKDPIRSVKIVPCTRTFMPLAAAREKSFSCKYFLKDGQLSFFDDEVVPMSLRQS